MQDQIQVTDVYETVYYLLQGAEILEIEPLLVRGKLICQIKLTGENIRQTQHKYFSGDAQVNLFDFRRSFSQVHSWMSNAKREFKKQLKEQEATSMAEGVDV